MCVGYPAKVTGLVPDLKCAQIECRGIRTAVSIALLEDVSPGEYVLVHAGVALEKLTPEAAAEIEAVLRELETLSYD
ncbi:MAG: HypC/HybG/HupF family hydrogenase formation chaperone [Negativicutes bacterium]|nr:HypC/HybG/HupF family hydrogenase formation chaperone [Negativicutes bacterium]